MPVIKNLNREFIIDGSRVRERRIAKMVPGPDGRKKSMTQEDLARLSGVDKGTISRIERGKHRSGSITVLMRLAVAIDCSLFYLLGIRDDHGPMIIVNAESVELLGYFDRLDERGRLVSLGILREAVEVFESLRNKKVAANEH